MDRRSFNRRMLLGGAAVATSMSLTTDAVGTDRVAKRAPAGGKDRHITLYAEHVGHGQMGYGLKRGKATIPGPLIEINEGDTLHIELVNTLDATASLHVHGLDYEFTSDGTDLSWSGVKPGGRRTYVWRTHTPGRRKDGTWREGSAGYWHYHDHVLGTEHGTGGVHKGLYGGVIVRRKGDILPDRTHTIVFNNMRINNYKRHHAPDFEAFVGERVEFVMITHGDHYHTFHMHGHRWAENRTGLLAGPDDHSRVVDNKIVGPGDAFGFQVIAGEEVGAGAWMYHCHVQKHADMGMAGLFLVKNRNGSLPRYQEHSHKDDESHGHSHGHGRRHRHRHVDVIDESDGYDELYD
ncbi:multicopper oxidase domain-containing protein [Streptomyces sp. NPDC052051]|uniref:multicopper oxidase domain-containing protein n=1 Tax=Streptomyces sp. NPDC052051 TaxID=3154649 RepID=UPI0034233B03